MALQAWARLLCASVLLQKSLTAVIQTETTVYAAAGDQVSLSCQLTNPKRVRLISWQKITPEGEKNIGTSIKGTVTVNPGFEGKVEFKDAGLQKTSIVVMNVTEQDKGCYRCLFNTYDDGAVFDKTCLTVYELHGPVLDVRDSNSSEEVVVSCWATGRPRPAVTLSVQQHKVNSSEDVQINTNGTDTVSVTAVLQRLYGNSTEVECAVQVLSVRPKKVFGVIPGVQQTSSADGSKEESRSGDSLTTVVVVAVVLASIVCIVVFLIISIMLEKRQQRSVQQKDPEVIKTPLRSSVDDHETKTPLLERQNEQTDLRQRTSDKKRESSVPKVSTCPAAGCKRKLLSLLNNTK